MINSVHLLDSQHRLSNSTYLFYEDCQKYIILSDCVAVITCQHLISAVLHRSRFLRKDSSEWVPVVIDTGHKLLVTRFFWGLSNSD